MSNKLEDFEHTLTKLMMN